MSQVDLATALDFTLDDESEAKFLALKTLQMKKLKQLTAQLDAKDKDISKLKILNKDNRRTQMIQALKNKIRDTEYVSEVLKEELLKSIGSGGSVEEINEMIIRKTLGGPKRFRPLSREELENKIIELERKLDSVERQPNISSQINSNNNSNTRPSAAADAKETSYKSQQQQKLSNQDTKGELNEPESSSSPKIADLFEQIQQLKQSGEAKDAVVEQQRTELTKLEARNADLVSAEEDSEDLSRRLAEQEELVATLRSELRDAAEDDAGLSEKRAMQMAELGGKVDDQKEEIKLLRVQCEKLTEQNAALMRQLLTMESDAIDAEQATATAKSGSADAAVKAKDSIIHSLEEKANHLEVKMKAQEAASIASEKDLMQQVAALKEQLREKNMEIREIKKSKDFGKK
eukprot:gene22887-29642_t